MNAFFSGAGLRRLRVMTHKELLQLFRDVALMVFFLYAFTGDIYIAASGVSMQLKNAAIATLDCDHSLASRELASRFQPPYFQAAGSAGTPQQAIRHLDDGDVMAVLDIPPRFGERLARGEQVAVQLQVDTSNSVLGFLASSYGAQIVGRYGLEVAALREGLGSGGISGPLIQADTRIWYNPNQNDAWFMGISELLTVITLFAILLPAAAMVREKERGTIEQLMVTPLSAFQILFPKVIAMTLVILAGTAIALFGVLGADLYVLHDSTKLRSFTDTLDDTVAMRVAWKCTHVLIEAKANGRPVIEVLEGKIPGLISIETGSASKESRASAMLPSWDAGQVWILEGAEWLDEWVTELCVFPRGKHDDRVDSLAQAGAHFRGNAIPLSKWSQYGKASKQMQVRPW